jgi:hypothetical protein
VGDMVERVSECSDDMSDPDEGTTARAGFSFLYRGGLIVAVWGRKPVS